MMDTKTYYVTGINGYRSPWMTKKQAETHAERLRAQMQTAGWAGKVRVYFRDGTEVRKAR